MGPGDGGQQQGAVGLIGAIAITVPLANGPTLVGPRAGDHGGGLQEGPREAHDVIDLQVDRPWK
jgi:hypothetical protein